MIQKIIHQSRFKHSTGLEPSSIFADLTEEIERRQNDVPVISLATCARNCCAYMSIEQILRKAGIYRMQSSESSGNGFKVADGSD